MDDILGPEVADHDMEWDGEPVSAHIEGRERERQYVERCREAMTPDCAGWAYLRGRGFTDEEIRRFGFGYDTESAHRWQDHRGAWHGERVVVPFMGCDWYHTDRATGDVAKGPKYTKPDVGSVGPQPFFNPDAIRQNRDCVFIVEGLLDAYAIEATGHSAIALAGTGWQDTVSTIAGRGYHGTVLALLDFDKPGREKNAELVNGLAREHVAVYAPELFPAPLNGCKDCGEALQRNRQALAAFLDKAEGIGAEEAERAAERRYDDALEHLHARNPATVAEEIYFLDDAEEPVPTGLAGLDGAIGGGLHNGLTVIGAISSLGKTSLCVQIADSIAASGRGVLFVTIEQSARELVAKSITRLMRQRSGCSVSTQDLVSRSKRAEWGERENTALVDANNVYRSSIAPHLRIYESERQPGVADIQAMAERLERHDGQPPVVIVDYLQLLAPQDERDSDKKAVDRNMTSLRQMAKGSMPVVVISSLNRSSYSGAISLDSFKESGGIEYSADLLLGLQPYGMAEKLDGVSEQRRKSAADKLVVENKRSLERPEEVVVLKNRSGGMPPQGVPMTFYPVSSLFRDGLHGQGKSSGVRVL